MPQLGQLFQSLSGKAGVKSDDEFLKKMLSFAEIMQTEVPDEFAKSLEQNLLTVESAIANPQVRGPLFAEYAGGVDDTIYKSVQDLEFDDQFKGELKNASNTKEKIKKIGEKTKQLLTEYKEKASKPANKEDHQKHELELASLKSEISRLNAEANNIKASYQTQIENLERTNEDKRRSYALRTHISNRPLVKIGETPKEIAVQTAENLIRQEMSKHNLVFHLDEFDNPFLKERKDGTEMEYYVDNKKVQFPDFVDGVLARNKLLQINDPTKNQQIQQPGSGAPITTGTGTPRNTSIASDIDATLNQLIGMTV
jgi:hypothetical protein